MNSSAAGSNSLLLIPDVATGRRFLVDTGAEVSIFPASGTDARTHPPGPPLFAANGSPIRTFGSRTLSLDLGIKTCTWPFILAEVSRPLIGADFLRHHELLVDLPNRRLLDARSLSSAHLLLGSGSAPQLASAVAGIPIVNCSLISRRWRSPVSRRPSHATGSSITYPRMGLPFTRVPVAFHLTS